MKTKKCCLFMRSLKFLGFVVSADGYRVDTERAEIIDQLQADDLKSLRTFIRVAEFVRQLIPNFAEVMAPLYKLKEHHRKCCWEAKQSEPYNRFRMQFGIQATIPSPIRQRRRYYLLMRQMWPLEVRFSRWTLWIKS